MSFEISALGPVTKTAITDSSAATATLGRPYTRFVVIASCAAHVALNGDADQDSLMIPADTLVAFTAIEGATISVIADDSASGDAYIAEAG